MGKSTYNFEDLIINESFRRWVSGHASLPEKKFWDSWVMENPENRALAVQAQQQMTGFSINPVAISSKSEVWKGIKGKMDRRPDHKKVYTHNFSRNSGTVWFFRVAAVLLLTGMTGLFVNIMITGQSTEEKEQVVRNEVVTDYGESKTIMLSDGSKIILNAHSSLIYTVTPSDVNAIEIFLDGEAHFSVAKRTQPGDAPFQVRTTAGIIKVLGTQFVVSTRNSQTQVVLEEGSIAISLVNGDENIILEPGQLAAFDFNSDTVCTEYVNVQVYTSWTTHMLVFDQTPLAKVINRLEHTFGIKVVVREPELYKHKISGSIENAGLEVIASALSKTLNTPVKITDKAVYMGEIRDK